MLKIIKIGLVGCGNIGTKRLISILKDKSVKIQYIVGPSKNINKNKSDCRGEELSKKINCIFSTNIEDIIHSDVDAVILSTGPTLFKEFGSKILKAKKHLLIEKPLGLNNQEARYLTNLANKNKLILKTGFNLRFDDGIKKAHEIFSSGALGKIYFSKIDYVNGSVKTNKNKVGALSDIGSHSLNLIEYFFTKKITNILCKKNSHEHQNDDNGFLIININKILCSIHFSFVRWKNDFSLEISGKKGYLKVSSLPKWGKQTVTYGKRVYPSGKPIIKNYYYTKDNSWYNEWLHFKNLIRNKSLKDNHEGLSNMKIINKINKIK
ncbi:Gfo/Idh/MocA family oxidoreductase [Candidatus Pelagibacter ubique]|nr:Gfo/Idh/MocA family oxidoreductase [Candidatus Pelagibacter ubique]